MSFPRRREEKAKGGEVTVLVEGVSAPLDDPRLVEVARRVFDYHAPDSVLLTADAGDNKRRINLEFGQPVYARIDGQRLAAAERLDPARLIELAEQGAGWRAVFEPTLARAS